jgi:hypothetical protein
MPTNIKITGLADIGTNISYNTLVPVVNMNGVPTTVSANLQVIGNLLLAGAGRGFFSSAANAIHAIEADSAYSATIAETVTTAAQPNITSTGTLENLSIANSVVLPALITITGSDPLVAVDDVIAFKIPIVIKGITYYVSLTAAP